ncbi:MAG: drug resistance transporter, EmrB/QacA subfamily [Thermoleophilia bacterium]|nr:drug resistance transporter, EmrB/QacA subfamily [Thermoleophilia bacterium]
MTDTVAAAQSSPISDEPVHEPWPLRWIALFVILCAEVMDLLDALATNIAAPSIRADLGGSETLVQWLGASYTLAMAIGLLTGGRLGDIFGRRRMFAIGAAGFTLGSIGCGLAADPSVLVAARLVQGLFGAIMLPQGLGMIREMFPPAERAKAFGLFGPVMGLSSMGGPILAGWLVDADYFGWGWRMIFLINVPLGIAAVVGARYVLPAGRGERRVRLDLVGAGIASVASGLLVYPLVQGREHDWPWWSFAMLAASAVTYVVFARQQVSRSRRGLDPLVEPSLFRKRAFTGGLLTGLLFFAALIGFSLTFTLFLQVGLGWSPLKAGLAGIPNSLGTVLGFALGAGLAARMGKRIMYIGATLFGVGVAAMALVVAGTHDTPTIWQLAAPMALGGAGMGLFMMPFFDLVLSSVDDHESGSASGTISSVQQFGSAIGIAILGTVFFQVVDGHVRTDGSEHAFGLAMQVALWCVVGITVLAALCVSLLPMRPREGVSPH